MLETHPFGNFVPKDIKYLLLGSFTGKIVDDSYDWFYGTKRNLFWPIIQEVYGIRFKDKKDKQDLFTKLKIGIADIILSCERSDNNNSDMNLANIVLNKEFIKILENNKIKKIFFSSKFVEKLFNKYFKGLILSHPKIELIVLPSPSPRYALMTKEEKIKKYREVLPQL